MIKIYCLINPDTGIPFYVGSTITSLNLRLSCHLSTNSFSLSRPRKNTEGRERYILIDALMKQGKRPIIKTLFVTAIENADVCETYFYSFFVSQGIDLLQSKNRIRNSLQRIQK